jgi:hypothetical protein
LVATKNWTDAFPGLSVDFNSSLSSEAAYRPDLIVIDGRRKAVVAGNLKVGSPRLLQTPPVPATDPKRRHDIENLAILQQKDGGV